MFIGGGRVGIAFGFGSAIWDCGKCFLADFSGSTIHDNHVYYSSGYLGYAFVVNGAKNLVIGPDNYVYEALPFSTAGDSCATKKWVGGKFLRGAFLAGNQARCGTSLHLGCESCSLQGGPWTDADPFQGIHLIGPFPRALPPSCN